MKIVKKFRIISYKKEKSFISLENISVSYNKNHQIHICNTCENRTDFKYVEIPYACKLMFQELLTMNIAPRIICE